MNGCFYYNKDTHSLKPAEFSSDEQFFGFCVLKDYEVIYREELPRFRKEPKIYALPDSDTPKRTYKGLCRFGLLKEKEPRHIDRERKKEFNIYNKSVTLLPTEEAAAEYTALHTDMTYYRTYFIRMAGQEAAIPDGYSLIGYDAVFPPACDGAFSLVYDCFFICKRYGCDAEGCEFCEEFGKLNESGLFDCSEDAFEFMKHYLSLGRTDNAACLIYEIYEKSGEKV